MVEKENPPLGWAKQILNLLIKYLLLLLIDSQQCLGFLFC